MNGQAPHQSDPVRRRRLRWRARRGLLENDLVLQRFFDAYETSLTDEDVAGLDRLLDKTDNDLLDLILGRKELADDAGDRSSRRVLQMLRQV